MVVTVEVYLASHFGEFCRNLKTLLFFEKNMLFELYNVNMLFTYCCYQQYYLNIILSVTI